MSSRFDTNASSGTGRGPDWNLEFSIPQRFLEIVSRFPRATAFVGPDVQLTYEEFNNLANRIACEVSSALGKEEGRVALVLEMGAHFYLSAMGALKADRCFVSFDPSLPIGRLREYFAIADIKAIVTNRSLQEFAEKLNVSGCPIVLAELGGTDCQYEDPLKKILPTNEAFIIFTSGSTGMPKGVIHSHQGALHNAFSFAHEYNLVTEDRILVLSTPAVYAAHRDMFLNLLSGATAYHYPLRQVGFRGLAKFLRTEKITIFSSIVTVFRRFTENLPDKSGFPLVRILKIGGEVSYWRDVDRAFENFSKEVRIFTGFSMTEANLVTANWTDKFTVRHGDRVPVGIPVAGKNIELKNESGNEVMPGEIGEICITSKYMAIGYLDGSKSDKQNFEKVPGDPCLFTFRTGDMGRLSEDGALTILGRADNQVKIRGYRVDLLEVESNIQCFQDISECAVRCHDIGGEDPIIVAYVTLKEGNDFSIPKIRAFLGQRLSNFMIPAHFVVMGALPQTGNGKLDRKALELPRAVSRESLGPFGAPRNELDAYLVSIWEDWIGVQGIGIEDDFFDVGGDSLSATQMLMQIHELYEAEFNADDVLNNCNTIRKMSDVLAESAPNNGERGGISRKAMQDINFVDANQSIENTNRPELYQLDRETGLRVGRPHVKVGKIALNNLGFRGPDIEAQKPVGRLRLAFVGSSSVFDPAVTANDQTWPHLTVEYLKRAFPDVEIDYVTAAFPGFSVTKCSRLFERFVVPLSPDIVVVQASDLNRDTAYMARQQGLFDGVPFRPSALARRFKFYLLMEKNLTVFIRQVSSLIGWRKLRIEADLAAQYKDRLSGLISLCQEDKRGLLLVDCRRLDPNMSVLQKVRSLTSSCLYMPYMSLKGFLKAEELYKTARKEAAKDTSCLYLDASQKIPSDGRHFADSTHFRDTGSRKMGNLVAEAITNDPEISSLFILRSAD